MSSANIQNKNHLLAALSAEDFEPLSTHLELVDMPLGDFLYEPGEPLHYAYFPTTAIVSLHFVTESGSPAEAASVGNEGIVGVSLFMGRGGGSGSAVVQTAGQGYRIKADILIREFERGGKLQRLLLRYTQVLMTLMARTAVCNRHHSAEQQLCRWLLFTVDRVPTRELVITQELIAGMLGVRRETITDAAGALQRAGYIRYRRGHITVLQRSGLEAHSCECYAVVKKELSSLLSDAQDLTKLPIQRRA